MANDDPTQPGTPPPELHGLDPGELLARGLHTVKASANSGPWEPPTPEDLARLLPQYLIESLLGRGGMGAVYKGLQVALDRPVAIKLLPAEIAADGDFIARFQREARTLARLQHSGIVTVYDFGQTSAGHLYFVMEYVDGTDLQRILKGPGLKPEQAFELIAQICDALYYAHRQGVIHRDIKPANILLTKDGRAKVADFGLARPIAEDSGGLTQTNMVMGTPDYMAPETRTSATHADHRADIFALGVMLYEMLTGHRPHGAFQPPSHRVQVDVRIDEVVLKALQQEPDRRYQQASEMKVDVDRIRTTPPTPAKPKRSKLLVAALALLGLIVLSLTIPALLRSLAQRSTVADSSPTPAAPITGTKDAPFVNSLGMKFVPVPGTDILMCIHETRRKDYAAYAAAVPGVDATWKNPMVEDKLLIQDDQHPVVEVSWEDAAAFCTWLSKNEGRTYRLPTEREWNLAVVFDVDDPRTISDADLKKILGPKPPQYPWGTRDEKDAPKYGNYVGKGDGHEGTAPVMSFLPNHLGIYDLGGNAWEWCSERGGEKSSSHLLLGCGYMNHGSYRWSGTRVSRAAAYRVPIPPLDAYNRAWIPGFRCVLVPASSERTAMKDEQQPAEAKKRLVEARAHLKAGEFAETRKLVEAALTTAPGDLTTQADAALIMAEAQVPERAAALAQEFVAQAEAEHPQFAAITELRVKLAPVLKQYDQHLRTAADLVGKGDDAGEIRELKAALALVPDGQQAAAKLAANPLHVGRALPGRRFTNELGHTFVPVDGLPNVLFSTWETRVKDFEQFVKETGYDMSQPRAGSLKTLDWKKLGFEQTGDHPVVMISRDDAEAFCRWLTQKERAAGRLLPGQVYRLPTDREWSAAMGVLDEPGDFPEERSFPKDTFTWEKGTSPPRNAENCLWKNDDFPNTAPVGSGLANRFGLYDMIGNVKEICADPWGFSSSPSIVLRGGSFRLPETWSHQRDTLSGGFVGHQNLDRAKVDAGFRCVLDLKSEAMRRVQTDLEAAVEKFHQTHTEGGKRVEFTTLATDEMVLLDMTRWGYPSGEALGIFAELPVTHFFVHGGYLRKPFDALKKMPLRVLSVDNLFPEDNFLETVRGLPLQWVLIDQNVQGKMSITSLGPLAGMKLKGLDLGNFKSLENFEPLRGMPLEALHLRGSTPTLDLKPLKGAPLVHLSVPKDASRQWLLEASTLFPTLARGLDFSAAQLLAPVQAALASGNDGEAARLLAEDEKAFADRRWWSGEFGKTLRKDYDKARAAVTLAGLVRRARAGDFAEITRAAKVFHGHAYLLVRGAITFDDGQRAAQALGGHLVTITSQEENDFLKREFMTAKDAPREILIGARREGTEGGWHGWKWVTGEEFPFTDWTDPEWSARPDAGLHVGLHVTEGKGKWYFTTGPRQAIIIEWDTPTPPPPAAAQ
jgi:serine/threonine protein kinase/formylglycine-generating enzyme required for sulfatase activity